MKEYIFGFVFGAVLIVGGVSTMYQIYRMTELDAKTRGLKHPKLWGLFAMNGNNSSGLLLYLIGRRKYPVTNITQADRRQIEARKKKVGVGMAFLVAGGIGLVASLFLP